MKGHHDDLSVVAELIKCLYYFLLASHDYLALAISPLLFYLLLSVLFVFYPLSQSDYLLACITAIWICVDIGIIVEDA